MFVCSTGDAHTHIIHLLQVVPRIPVLIDENPESPPAHERLTDGCGTSLPLSMNQGLENLLQVRPSFWTVGLQK